MSQPTRPPRRQLALNLGPEIAAPARVPASPVLLQALAEYAAWRGGTPWTVENGLSLNVRSSPPADLAVCRALAE